MAAPSEYSPVREPVLAKYQVKRSGSGVSGSLALHASSDVPYFRDDDTIRDRRETSLLQPLAEQNEWTAK